MTTSTSSVLFCFALCLAGLGCSSDESTNNDPGQQSDVGHQDATAPEDATELLDTTSTDTGESLDLGAEDSGAEDSGAEDSGAEDSGVEDSGAEDSASPDVVETDAAADGVGPGADAADANDVVSCAPGQHASVAGCVAWTSEVVMAGTATRSAVVARGDVVGGAWFGGGTTYLGKAGDGTWTSEALLQHSGGAVALDGDGTLWAALGVGQIQKVWMVREYPDDPEIEPLALADTVTHAAVTALPDGTLIVAALHSDGTVTVRDGVDGTPATAMTGQGAAQLGVAAGPNGQVAVAQLQGATLSLARRDSAEWTPAEVQLPPGVPYAVIPMALDGQGGVHLAYRKDSTLTLTSMPDSQPASEVVSDGSAGGVSIAVGPDGTVFVTDLDDTGVLRLHQRTGDVWTHETVTSEAVNHTALALGDSLHLLYSHRDPESGAQELRHLSVAP